MTYRKKANKKLVILRARSLFLKKGYSATSMQDIANACQIKKPSLYHYVSSREELLSEVVLDYIVEFKQHIFKSKETETLSLNEKLYKLMDDLDGFYSENRYACLIGKLCYELDTDVSAVKPLFESFFSDFISYFIQLFHVKMDLDRATQLAEECVAQIQGALLLIQLNDKRTQLKENLRYLLNFAILRYGE